MLQKVQIIPALSGEKEPPPFVDQNPAGALDLFIRKERRPAQVNHGRVFLLAC